MRKAPSLAKRILGTGLGWLCILALPVTAWADKGTTTGLGNPASASLAFAINIDKFVSLRIGTAGSGISTVNFVLTPSIPSGPTAPVNGNNKTVNWNSAAPTAVVASSGNVLQVEVRSNGGQVSLRATTPTSGVLTSGTNTIPMSSITIASPSTLPAPPLANSGNGASVTVPTTSFGLVTEQTGDWTFSYAPGTLPTAGTYTGQVTFTASVL